MKLKDLLFPAKCILCNKLLIGDEKHLCVHCAKDLNGTNVLKRNGAFFDKAYGFLSYSGKARQAIHRYKYYGKIHYALFFAQNMAICYGRMENTLPHIITAVPSQPSRRAKRGFDHAFLLASEVGKRLGVEACPLLKKSRNTSAMYGLSPERRRANVRGSITFIGDPDKIKGKDILLIDDILTTGSTASECARVLKTAGAKSVTVLVAAITEKKN